MKNSNKSTVPTELEHDALRERIRVLETAILKHYRSAMSHKQIHIKKKDISLWRTVSGLLEDWSFD
jgi:hypothetical protein